MSNVLYLFHHIHYSPGQDEIHHCGHSHKKNGGTMNYHIKHCPCGQHAINRKTAIGHTIDLHLRKIPVKIIFNEKCPRGGWHIESGKKA